MSKDISGWCTRLTDEMASQYRKEGRWHDKTILEHVASRAADPKRGHDDVEEGGKSASFSGLLDDARRLAVSLSRMGLKPGDVISFQLPNWLEAVVIDIAACMNGYICNPIVPIYRDTEVEFILADAQSKVFFIPEKFRNFDYTEMAHRLQPNLPKLEHVIVVRGENCDHQTFNEVLAGGIDEDWVATPPDPNSVKLLMYTSGTTGNPKGVLHSHNTLMSELVEVARYWQVTDQDVVLMPSPVTHITGFLYGLELGLVFGAKVSLMERWDASEAVDKIQQQNVTMSVGATPFLAELVAEAERQEVQLESIRFFGCGGAPVSPEIVRRAKIVLPNCLVARIYGSTEAPTVTLGVNSFEDQDLGASTDGRIVNHEVQIVDITTGDPVADNIEGEVITRGPELMLGYTDSSETQKAFDSEGYFHTGDLAYRSHSDFLTITGRIKDLIIRGGENLSPKDIEDTIHSHPDIRDVAVVGMPHPRLGETACAFVELKPGCQLGLPELKKFLEDARIAKQKIPEKLVVLEQLPRTASGKIQKQSLREKAKQYTM